MMLKKQYRSRSMVLQRKQTGPLLNFWPCKKKKTHAGSWSFEFEPFMCFFSFSLLWSSTFLSTEVSRLRVSQTVTQWLLSCSSSNQINTCHSRFISSATQHLLSLSSRLGFTLIFHWTTLRCITVFNNWQTLAFKAPCSSLICLNSLCSTSKSFRASQLNKRAAEP